jgi:formylglycine-generating enzyme required for sulfatase activity
MGGTVRGIDDFNLPKGSVSWNQAREFCRKLSELPEEKAAGRSYRLPTEAEWEYACRAGATTAYCFGDDAASEVGNFAWYADNSAGSAQARQAKTPNAWGLYDMHGNLWEWCEDPLEPGKTDNYALRGGSYREPADRLQCVTRSYGSPIIIRPDAGFRVACDISGK